VSDVRQFDEPHGGVEGGEELVFRMDVGLRQAVEEGGFAGVGISGQGDDGVGDLAARLAVQLAGARDLLELAGELADALREQAAVGLDLGFAGAAHEAEAASLALQMRPRAHKAGFLIVQMRKNVAEIGDIKRLVQMRQGFCDLAGQPAPAKCLKQRPQTGIEIRLGINACHPHAIAERIVHVFELFHCAPVSTGALKFDSARVTRALLRLRTGTR